MELSRGFFERATRKKRQKLYQVYTLFQTWRDFAPLIVEWKASWKRKNECFWMFCPRAHYSVAIHNTQRTLYKYATVVIMSFWMLDTSSVLGRPWDRKNKNKKQSTLALHRTYRKPRAVPSVVTGHFCIIRYLQRKKRVFRTQHLTEATSPRLVAHGSQYHLDGVRMLHWEYHRIFAAKFEGRRWSVSRGLAWDVGAWHTVSPIIFFPIGNDFCSVVPQKVDTERVRLPRPKRDPETQTTYGLQTWQRGL